MKKALFVLAFAALVSPSFAHAAFTSDLKYGSTGAKVYELQEFLTAQGVYTGPITGNFYSLTLAAVKAFQAANNVSPVSGYFGPLTRGVANDLLAADLEASNEEAAAQTPVEEVQVGSSEDSSVEEAEEAPAPVVKKPYTVRMDASTFRVEKDDAKDEFGGIVISIDHHKEDSVSVSIEGLSEVNDHDEKQSCEGADKNGMCQSSFLFSAPFEDASYTLTASINGEEETREIRLENTEGGYGFYRVYGAHALWDFER